MWSVGPWHSGCEASAFSLQDGFGRGMHDSLRSQGRMVSKSAGCAFFGNALWMENEEKEDFVYHRLHKKGTNTVLALVFLASGSR